MEKLDPKLMILASIGIALFIIIMILLIVTKHQEIQHNKRVKKRHEEISMLLMRGRRNG